MSYLHRDKCKKVFIGNMSVLCFIKHDTYGYIYSVLIHVQCAGNCIINVITKFFNFSYSLLDSIADEMKLVRLINSDPINKLSELQRYNTTSETPVNY